MRQLLLLGIAILLATPAFAIETDSSDLASPGPILGGHLFQPLGGMPGPFIRTVSQVTVGGGTTLNLELPIITIGDRIVVAPKGSLAIVSMQAFHEQRIKDWLSVYGGFRLVGRLGTNVTSLLSQGVNTATSFNLGWKVRVIETRKFLGTLSLDLTNGTVATVDVDQWIAGVIDSSAVVSENPLVQTKPVLITGLTARGAYAFNETFGLSTFIAGLYGEAIVRGGNAAIYFDGGIALNADLRPTTDVPVAIAGGIVYRQTPSVDDATSGSSVTTGSLRIGYSGTQHFAFGFQINAQYGDVGGEKQAFFVGGALDMRFYY